MAHALGYIRTSSLTNAEGDSVPRQRAAIAAYAARAGLDVAGEYADVVTGADPIEGRTGFAALLAHIAGNGVRVVIVEDASRFARSLMVQEAGIALLQGLGVKLVTAGGENLTDSSDPDRVFIRQVLGAAAQAEKARLVAKLRASRDRKSAEAGARIEGRKAPTAIIERCKALRAEGATLQAICDTLAAEGIVSATGKAFDIARVSRYLSRAAD